MTTHENILLLSEYLERREGVVTRFDRDSYNGQVNNMIEAMSNFVSLHYALSSREDNQYWRDVTENIDYVNMGKHLYSEIDAMANTWMLMNSVENTFIKEHDEQSGSIYICAGQDYIPFGKASYKEKIGIHSNPYDVKEAHEQYQKDRQAMKDWSHRQPTHYEYLRDNIYNV